MLRKISRYVTAAVCLLLCMAMPFLMLSLDRHLETLFDAMLRVPCTVSYTDTVGRVRTVDGATYSFSADKATIRTADGHSVTIPARQLVRRSSNGALLSKSTLLSLMAAGAVGLLLLVALVPLNAYLIQFSIEETGDGRFHPFDAA